jgi:hypothetical protein
LLLHKVSMNLNQVEIAFAAFRIAAEKLIQFVPLFGRETEIKQSRGELRNPIETVFPLHASPS